ncbi:sushi, von Willebrand factor type A, EGF and pentraxin domain-containing protein 1-like [Gigantopelta aegis]|uniref:sushi, von Willebrand factor type A, EGF and pentraxin domain-containing protein 1-like n=1 Tax=Gigantopelta aegis TaxID=1735272 RepID=UPI001B889996|nr:sushi, von Willebrand factor type A, EGF and pentraxin domain-containing protein 1-like [Gigantopelta aegis]
MHYLKVFCLAYLLCVQLTTSVDLLSEIKQTINHVKRQHHEKGCTALQESTSCTLPAAAEETRSVDTDKSALPHNTECVTYDGCYTCMEGSWVTSSCPEEQHHRGKRAIVATIAAVVGIVSGIVGIIQAGVEIYCKFFCKGDDGEEYRPPQFTSCDGPASPINTPSGERAAVVTWQKPAYQEGNAGEPKLMLVSTSGDSGNTFEAGYYTITYHLVDNQGYKDSCSFSFQVKVRTCPWPGYLPNGQIVCGSGDIMYGDKCQVSCNQGYHLEGLSTITCEANENFNADLPTCQPKQCPVLGTPPHSTDFSCTDGDNYNSVCTLTCDSAAGFSSSPRLTICQEDTNWLQPVPRCKDTLKPEFTNCPSQAIQAYADRGKTTAVVIWKPPIASDNSGNVTVEQVAGLQPGQTFNEGSSMIKYTATDPSGQKAYCIFAVNVVTISCELPSFSDDNLMFDCTHGYRYGSQCTVSCKAGLPLNGTNTIVCEKDNSLSPVTYWDLGGGIPPYCIKRPCAVLTAPKHGALSCDNNMGGSFCTMSCEANWDIPRSAISVSMYTCGWAKGNWIPTADVPDCTAKHVANRLRLKSELNYYSGNCSDPSTLAEIKQKFVLVLDNSGLWTDGCPCTVEDVTVICGEARRRRRRRGVDIHEDKVEKRSTVPAAIITWHWAVPIQNGSISSADEQLIARAERMFSLVRNNQLDIGVAGFEVKPGSFGYGESNLVCPPGYLGTYRTGTCSPCPAGMMYSKTANDCVRCPLGTYQDEEGQFQCKPCPRGFKTIVGGARTQDKCIELCAAGHYSNSSVVPCDACPVGKYQPDAGSSACLSCDFGTTTSGTASTSASACQSFDVIVDGPATILSKGGLDANTDDWTISMWMSTRSAEGSIEMKQPDGTLPFKLTFGQTSLLSLFGLTVSDMNMPTSRWIHVSIVYKHGASTVTVYKNGVADNPRTTQSVPSPVFRSGSKLQVKLQTQSDITIRSVFVIPSALSPTDVQLLASSCGNKPNTFNVSINDLIAGSSPETVRVTTPTTCDAVDECQHNSPCNGHTCINCQVATGVNVRTDILGQTARFLLIIVLTTNVNTERVLLDKTTTHAVVMLDLRDTSVMKL